MSEVELFEDNTEQQVIESKPVEIKEKSEPKAKSNRTEESNGKEEMVGEAEESGKDAGSKHSKTNSLSREQRDLSAR